MISDHVFYDAYLMLQDRSVIKIPFNCSMFPPATDVQLANILQVRVKKLLLKTRTKESLSLKKVHKTHSLSQMGQFLILCVQKL